MADDAKQVLDLRLARGEISLSEHARLLKAITNTAARTQPLIDLPDFKWQLWDDGFDYNGAHYGYDRVTCLVWDTFKQTHNFVSLGSYASVSFEIREGPRFEATVTSGMFTNKLTSVLQKAYEVVRDRSFKTREMSYWVELGNRKLLQFDDATIDLQGVVRKNGVEISLRDAVRAGGLHFGTMSSFGLVNLGGKFVNHYPNEVLLELPNPRRRISFTVIEDHDAVRSVLEALGE